MRFLPIAGLAGLLLTAPAVAQASNADTYKEVVGRGIVISLGVSDIDASFDADGRLSAVVQQKSKASWRIDGDRLCTTPDETMIESCLVYPPGKKSGDTFEIETPSGRVTIRIK